MNEVQKRALIFFAKYPHRIGTRRLRVTTFDVLRRLGLIEPAGENDNPYTGIFRLTAQGAEKLQEILKGTD